MDPVMAPPPLAVLDTLIQNDKVYGVPATGADINNASEGVPGALHDHVSPVAGVWVPQFLKSTKQSSEAYVPVPGVAKPQPELGLAEIVVCSLWGELGLGTATSV
jgi:hypothetical protein